jgi:LmbE family N-acetylglucosaminyl deacetylase
VTNCARFANRPLTVGGTTADAWRDALKGVAELDLTGCNEIVVVAAHPDDETLGFGASTAMLVRRGVRVRVVAVSDGSASHPHLKPAERDCLAQTRQSELSSATRVLGVGEPSWLGLPDGAVSDHEDPLADLLSDILRDGAWCAANWRGDGHPDHEAVGRAAAVATARTGTVLLEYPVWMWHWAAPGDAAVPWNRLVAMPVTANDVGTKATAAQCYRSQLDAPSADSHPVLAPFVVERLLSVKEVVFR